MGQPSAANLQLFRPSSQRQFRVYLTYSYNYIKWYSVLPSICQTRRRGSRKTSAGGPSHHKETKEHPDPGSRAMPNVRLTKNVVPPAADRAVRRRILGLSVPGRGRGRRGQRLSRRRRSALRPRLPSGNHFARVVPDKGLAGSASAHTSRRCRRLGLTCSSCAPSCATRPDCEPARGPRPPTTRWPPRPFPPRGSARSYRPRAAGGRT